MTFKRIFGMAAIAVAAIVFTGCVSNDTPTQETRVPGAIDGSRGNNTMFDPGMGSGEWDNPGGLPPDDSFADRMGIPGFKPLTGPDAPVFPTIYFDFDRDNIKPEYREAIQQVADYLKTYQELGLIIEGHTDDVGTNEYNRALGERRALSIVNAMSEQGISEDRLGTISYGEDMPAVPGTDSAARAQNRRGELIPAAIE